MFFQMEYRKFFFKFRINNWQEKQLERENFDLSIFIK